ncbi:sensor histidine kinase [Actinocorallia sp. A-T 12471]|uniref:sensor histidine kinase n=1 Tax=Actinocorallia sp. A-T 12471 TaxID=3089813 RepID=UPI0029D1C469|nr:histidine kinase [Actinocorallia sp. A-T 12471]MDX6741380.1 histidine kinase [Actinocorallia sp. A-T 12471]
MSVPSLLVRARRLAGSPWADAALALVLAAAQTAPLLFRSDVSGQPWHWWGYVVAIGASLPVAARRRAPVTVLVVCITVGSLYDLVDVVAPQPLWYGVLVALYGVASLCSAKTRLTIFTLVCGIGLLTVGSADTAARGIVMYAAAYALGRAAAGRRAQAEALEERAARLERDRRVDAERAAERERARIARDMHDVLAHSISLMVVQAEAGAAVVERAPARAADAFEAIAGTGRDALDQLRRMLSVLKDADGTRAPQPTVADVPALAAQVNGAGLAAVCVVEGEPRALPADCGVAAYRIVQEALTNAVKHSGAASAEVRLHWHADGLDLRITDDGRGAAHALPSGGHGLIGVRERAAACGGTAKAGPRSDGLPGFEVSARLPVAARLEGSAA